MGTAPGRGVIRRMTMDFVLSGLGEGAHHHEVDVHVVRPGDRPGHAVGDVLGGQRLPPPPAHGPGGRPPPGSPPPAFPPEPSRFAENSSVFTIPGAISMIRTGSPTSSSRSVSA